MDWKKIFAAAKIGGIKNYFVEMDLEKMKSSVPYTSSSCKSDKPARDVIHCAETLYPFLRARFRNIGLDVSAQLPAVGEIVIRHSLCTTYAAAPKPSPSKTRAQAEFFRNGCSRAFAKTNYEIAFYSLL